MQREPERLWRMAGISLKAKGILTRIIYLYRRKFFQIKPPIKMGSPKSTDPSFRHSVVYFPGNEATWAIMKLKKWRSRLYEDEIAENKKCKIKLNTDCLIFLSWNRAEPIGKKLEESLRGGKLVKKSDIFWMNSKVIIELGSRMILSSFNNYCVYSFHRNCKTLCSPVVCP